MELFKGWLENHFIKHAVGASDSSSYNPEAVRLAREKDIFTLVLTKCNHWILQYLALSNSTGENHIMTV